MLNIKLSESKLQDLIQLHRQIKEKKIAYRINAIILLAQGFTYPEVEKVLLLDDRTIRRYRDLYLEEGAEGLLASNYKGRQPELTEQQEEELVDHLEKNLYTTAAEICKYIEETYNVNFTPDGMVITLHRLGFSYKKTKIVPSKADKEKQEKFVEKYDKLKNNLKPNEKIYFMDGVHPTHNVMPAYGWIKKGKDKEVKSNSGRQRINLNGVYCADDNEIIIRGYETINSESTIKLLQEIEEKHPELDKIYIIRDNARYYTAQIVKDFLKNSKIEFIALPGYSPNLNLIERLWKFFKKKTLYNR
jgi:transposase